ncbi:MAG: AraC family transcriptional regulator [Pseudomonadota bacterium]
MAGKKQPFIDYEDRLNRVLCYISEHLDEDLNLDQLADVACLSRYHWHRIFRAMTGETLADIVQRMRLNKAANALVEGNEPIRTIAEQVGYQNLASFSRAFKRMFGLSPNELRQKGERVSGSVNSGQKGEPTYPVTIRKVKEIRAAGVLHVGSYRKLGGAFNKLGGLLMAQSLMPHVDELFVIYRDPPESKPVTELRAHVAVSIRNTFPTDLDGLEYFDIIEGRYAVLEHTGPYQTLGAAYEWLYGHWLPTCGLEPRDAPPLEVYVNDPRTTLSTQLRTDVRLPLL